jgi:hypothetical protein
MSTCFGDSGTESSGYTSIEMSKSLSSASNTTTSTSPAEALPLERLEHVDMNQFIGIANIRKAIDLQSKRLQEGVSNQQYLVFRPVTEVDLAKIDSTRNSIGKHTRMAYYTDTNLLVIKLMPLGKHESAYLSFSDELHAKLFRIGISYRELYPISRTRYPGYISSKKGNLYYKPSSQKKEADWPTIVIESGLSESLQHLRYDARW